MKMLLAISAIALVPAFALAEEAKPLPPPIDMTKAIPGPDGDPVPDVGYLPDIDGRAVPRLAQDVKDDPLCKKCRPLTYGENAYIVLQQWAGDNGNFPGLSGEELGGQKRAVADLGLSVRKDKAARLGAKQVSKILEASGKYNPGYLLDQMSKLLDPNKPVAELK